MIRRSVHPPSLTPPSGAEPNLLARTPLVVPPPDIIPATQVRGLLLASSRQALCDAGHFDRYKAFLKEAEDEALSLVQSRDWVPIALAMAHYQACDQLQLPQDDIQALGDAVGGRMNQSVLLTIVRLATSVFSPLHGWRRVSHLWERAFIGSAIAVWQLGERKIQVQVLQCPLTDIRYFRQGLVGLIQGNTELFSKKATVRLGFYAPGQANYSVTWI